MPKKILELKQTHGRAETPMNLDQLMGVTGMSEYGTLDEKEYTGQLEEMNTHDLHEHAVGKGILPMDNRDRLVKTLMGEFKKHVAHYQAPHLKTPKSKIPGKNVASILAEGR